MRGEESNTTQEKQVAQHPLTNTKPVPELCLAPVPGDSPQFIYWVWHSVVWNILLNSLGHLS